MMRIGSGIGYSRKNDAMSAINQSGGGMGLKASLSLSSSPCRSPSLFHDSFDPVPGVYSLAITDAGRSDDDDDDLERRALELELELAGCLDAPL